jgi:hypothetical protein
MSAALLILIPNLEVSDTTGDTMKNKTPATKYFLFFFIHIKKQFIFNDRQETSN